MITVLRIISQICQCLQGQSKQVEQQAEKSSLPLYLRQGQGEEFQKEDFVKYLESLNSKRSNHSTKPLISTKRNMEGQILDIYEFPQQFEQFENKRKPQNGTQNTENDKQNKLHSSLQNQQDLVKNTSTGKDNQKGNNTLFVITDKSADQEQKSQIVTKKKEEEYNNQEKDQEGNKQNKEKEKSQQEKQFDFVMIDLKPQIKRSKSQQRSNKNGEKNKGKQKNNNSDNVKSAYLKGFPKKVASLALHIQQKDHQQLNHNDTSESQ